MMNTNTVQAAAMLDLGYPCGCVARATRCPREFAYWVSMCKPHAQADDMRRGLAEPADDSWMAQLLAH